MTYRCGICNRKVRPEVRRVDGLGHVGDECVKKVRGIERAFSLLNERHPYARALQLKTALRGLGLNAQLRPDVVNGWYRVCLKGGAAKAVEDEVQAKYRSWLLGVAAEFDGAVAA